MSCRAAFLGNTRLTPTPDEIADLDYVVRSAAEDAGQSNYITALHLLWHAQKAMTPGFSRFDPIHEVRPARPQRPVVDEIPEGQG